MPWICFQDGMVGDQTTGGCCARALCIRLCVRRWVHVGLWRTTIEPFSAVLVTVVRRADKAPRSFMCLAVPKHKWTSTKSSVWQKLSVCGRRREFTQQNQTELTSSLPPCTPPSTHRAQPTPVPPQLSLSPLPRHLPAERPLQGPFRHRPGLLVFLRPPSCTRRRLVVPCSGPPQTSTLSAGRRHPQLKS